jgi:hypothetical protein
VIHFGTHDDKWLEKNALICSDEISTEYTLLIMEWLYLATLSSAQQFILKIWI